MKGESSIESTILHPYLLTCNVSIILIGCFSNSKGQNIFFSLFYVGVFLAIALSVHLVYGPRYKDCLSILCNKSYFIESFRRNTILQQIVLRCILLYYNLLCIYSVQLPSEAFSFLMGNLLSIIPILQHHNIIQIDFV